MSQISPQKTFDLNPTALAVGLFMLALLPRAILGWYFPQFNGDIARDAYALKDVLSGHLVLVGPHISRVGDVFPHLGPLLYYLILPFLYLGRFHQPQLGNLPIVLLDSLASVLLFKLIYKRYGASLGVIAWMFYAFAVNNVFWGSFFWNGNYGPAAVICCWYLLDEVLKSEVRRPLVQSFANDVPLGRASALGETRQRRSPEAGGTKKQRYLLALSLVALTHMHLVFWCFVLPALALTIRKKLGIWRKFLVLQLLSLLPLLLAEVQSNWANSRAFFASQQTVASGWPLHNLLYLYQTVMATYFWHDKMHRDLNSFLPSESPLFYLSLLFVLLNAVGLVMLLRQKKKDTALLCLPAVVLLLLFPAKLNAERYWLFVSLPLGIASLSSIFAVLWRRRSGMIVVYTLLSCFLVYNVATTRQLLRDVSRDRYETDGTTMVSVQEIERRANRILGQKLLPAIALVSSIDTARANRGFLPLRYFAELSGKRVLAPPLDPGREFNTAFFFPQQEQKTTCLSDDERIAVFWMHTRDEPSPVPGTTDGKDIYWATFEGTDYFGRYLDTMPCSQVKNIPGQDLY